MSEARRTGGFTLFALWFGAAISLAEIMTGSLLAPLGLKQGIIAVLAGHLVGTLIFALVGIIGFRERTPSLISSRLSLGRYGSYPISVFNIIQLLGWTAIMLIQCARSLQAITGSLLGLNSFVLPVLFTGLLVGIWALTTDRGISAVNNAAVALLFFLGLIMLKAVLQGGGAVQLPVPGGISFGAALELSIVMPLSWMPMISDYTQTARSAGGSFFGSFAGYFLGSSFMYLIGLLSALYAGASDPIGILARLNMGYPALLIVILATVTTTFLDVYSAVLTTLNLTARFSKSRLILVFTILGTALALYFPMEQYENFLYLIGAFLAPVFSVVIVDYFIFRDDRSQELWNVSGLAAAAVGTVAYYLVLKLDLVIGSTVPAIIITVGVYLLLRFLSNRIILRRRKTCLTKLCKS